MPYILVGKTSTYDEVGFNTYILKKRNSKCVCVLVSCKLNQKPKEKKNRQNRRKN